MNPRTEEQLPRTKECAAPDEAAAAGALQPEDAEFHLTIRKLELPVRPRGVLAE